MQKLTRLLRHGRKDIAIDTLHQVSRIIHEVRIMYEDNSAVMDIEPYDDDKEEIPNETTLRAMAEADEIIAAWKKFREAHPID